MEITRRKTNIERVWDRIENDITRVGIKGSPTT